MDCTKIPSFFWSNLSFTLHAIHPYIHKPMAQPLGGIWGSVCCPRILLHAYCWSLGSTFDPPEPQPSLSTSRQEAKKKLLSDTHCNPELLLTVGGGNICVNAIVQISQTGH